jgi:hypothetical protein
MMIESPEEKLVHAIPPALKLSSAPHIPLEDINTSSITSNSRIHRIVRDLKLVAQIT